MPSSPPRLEQSGNAARAIVISMIRSAICRHLCGPLLISPHLKEREIQSLRRPRLTQSSNLIAWGRRKRDSCPQQDRDPFNALSNKASREVSGGSKAEQAGADEKDGDLGALAGDCWSLAGVACSSGPPARTAPHRRRGTGTRQKQTWISYSRQLLTPRSCPSQVALPEMSRHPTLAVDQQYLSALARQKEATSATPHHTAREQKTTGPPQSQLPGEAPEYQIEPATDVGHSTY